MPVPVEDENSLLPSSKRPACLSKNFRKTCLSIADALATLASMLDMKEGTTVRPLIVETLGIPAVLLLIFQRPLPPCGGRPYTGKGCSIHVHIGAMG